MTGEGSVDGEERWERDDVNFGRENFVRSLSLRDDLDDCWKIKKNAREDNADAGIEMSSHTCASSGLNSGLTTSFFSATKYGVETECEDKPRKTGAAAMAEERRELERASAELRRRLRGGGQTGLSTLYSSSSSSSSSSKKELLGSDSRTSAGWRCIPEALPRTLRGSELA